MDRDARTPAQWFEEAVRWYVEAHQGCPCCGEQHCVYRSVLGACVEYYCTSCDFSACLDEQTGQYYAVQGNGDERPSGIFSRYQPCGFGPVW
jgi:hypothetical protein